MSPRSLQARRMASSGLVAVVIVFAGGLGFGLAPVVAQPTVPSYDEIVKSMAAVNIALQSLQVEQAIEVRLWFLRYRVSSTVYAARPARYRVVLHNPPWFLRSLGNVFAHVGRPEDVLVDYLPKTVAWEDAGRRLLYLDVTRRLAEINPPRVEAWVDAERWLVQRTIFHYDWGDVAADYQFGLVEGYWLPLTIALRISGYALSATLIYQNYQLNIPISDAVFSTR